MNKLTHAYAQMECMSLEEAHTTLNELAWDCYAPVEFLNDCGLPLIHLYDATTYARGEFLPNPNTLLNLNETQTLEPKIVGKYEGDLK